MISVSGLGKSFGAQVLFADVSFQLNPGERYGLVGANGSGKTTLLNILAGFESPSEGSVSLPRRVKLGVLRQDQFLYEDESILGVTMMGNQELWEAIAEKEALLAEDEDSFDAERFSELEEIVQLHDGYAAEARAAEILEGLGLPSEVHHQPLSTLSGGFKLRVLLAQVLAGAPDALLLDEPTNHLDILSIRWLEKFLKEFAGPVLVISHDHRFLDYVCTNILDVDYQTVIAYKGNYSKFVKAKRAERERRGKEIDKREKEIAHHKQFIDRFRAKSSKARQAQSKLRLIEKKAEGLEELPQSSRRYPTFTLKQTRASGREVLRLEGVKKAFGDNEVLHGVDLTVRRGDRLAIMGPNGIGKSTLLKVAVGELEADAGEVEWGYETHPGYFAQDHRDQLQPPDRTAEAWLWEFCPGELIGYVRNQLGRVLFSGDEAKKPLKALSGGEAARLVFCKLAVQQPNVLVLDEPTNHLDLESIEALVEGLQSYPGTLIFVSHDRWFVSQLARRILEIKPGEVFDYEGTYEEYVHYCGDDHLDVDTVVLKARREKRRAKVAASESEAGADEAAPTADEGGERPKKISKNRLRQMKSRSEKLLVEVEKAEARIEEINQVFCDPTFYERSEPAAVRRLEEEQKGLQAEVEALMSQWEAAEEELANLQ
jgi:ATPase subunit of ABC transporter with duplicated ATPase domains